MDADHLDIYGTAEAVEQAFIDFSEGVKPGGLLLKQFGLKRGKDLKASRQWTYSLQNDSASAYAKNIKIVDGSYEYDVVIGDKVIENIVLHMGGMHNVENSVAAIAIASSLEIDNDRIRKAVGNFRGVKRRFEYIIKNKRLVFIDDYAHHPEELRALITGARALFPQRRCTLIFQPHLYTRTRDLADGFAEVLDMANEVVLLPIYPARELPIAGVSSEMILNKMKNEKKHVMEKDELLKWTASDYAKRLNNDFGETLIVAGAGDIDSLVEPIKKILEHK
jgi:UDP-N-acetylmuramate--alanine ligase